MPIPRFQGCGDREGHPEEEGEGDGNQDRGGVCSFVKVLIYCSEGSEQEAERGADKGPACQGTGICVGGGEINDLSSTLTFSFSPPIFLRHILLIFCAHFLQTHSLLLLSGQGRLTLCSQLYLAVRKLTLC